MELFGKVVSPKRESKANSTPELVINAKSNRINLSNQLMEDLGCHEGNVGFGYDPNQTVGSTPAFMYLTEEGCKIGKSGAVTNKFHSEKLMESFTADLSEDATRFRLAVDTNNSIDYNGTILYPISFKEQLKNITRTRAAHAQVEDSSQPEFTDIPEEEAVLHSADSEMTEEEDMINQVPQMNASSNY